jgi:glyoxylase-like metal-dependent hydrolase (beta-lactamase superfamily II)
MTTPLAVAEPWEFASGVFRLRTDYPETVGAPLWLYLFRDSESVLCDAATATTFDATLRGDLARLGMVPADVTWALLTHGHPDHTGAIHSLRAAGSSIRVAAPIGDVTWIESFDRQWREFWEDLPGVVDVAPVRDEFKAQSGGDVMVDRLLRDGDLLEAGSRRFRTILTRGHTWGHSAYLEESTGVLLTGDIGVGRSIASTDGSSQYPALYLDVDDHLEGLLRLRATPFDWMCAAHLSPVPRGEALALIDTAIALVDEVDQLVLDMVLTTDQAVDLRDIAAALGRHLGMLPEVWAHTAFVARAHLNRAARRGLVAPSWRRT